MNIDPNQSQDSRKIAWKKLPRWLRILLGVLLLLSALASGYTSITSSFYDPAPDTVLPYYDAIKHQDYATAFKYLAPGLKDVTSGAFITEPTFAQQAEDIDRPKGKVSSYTITNVAAGGRNDSSSNAKTYTIAVTRNGTSYDVNVYVQRQLSGAWQIIGFDTI